MVRKQLLLVVVLCLLVSIPAYAYTAKDLASFTDSPVAIAWADGGTIYVAIANEATARRQMTIELYDRYGRNPVERATLIVPSRTVMIESFSPRFASDVEEVIIYSYSRTKKIVVQRDDLFSVRDYVVPANSSFTVGVDFHAIKGNSNSGSLVIDQNFQISGTNRSGQINVSTFDNGYNYNWGNTIQYYKPSLELRMWIPWMQGVGVLSFGITHLPDWPGSRTYYYAPAVLVYGEDFRLVDVTNYPKPNTPAEPGYSNRVPK